MSNERIKRNSLYFTDGLTLFTDDKNSPGQLEGLERFNEVDIPKKSEIFQLDSTNQLDSLQQVSFLREKLAEKAKSELELIEEKNKLLKIVKEYNESLANERDNLKERIIDQDQTIKVETAIFIYVYVFVYTCICVYRCAYV